ncbi:MAG: hypothetical protein ACRD5H_10585, partial [Nitrososphaerales archaeon]
ANFSDIVNISQNDVSSFSQAIRVSGDGDVHVVWVDIDADESGSEIFLSTSTDNGDSFGCPINLSTNSGFSFSPKISLASDDNNLQIVWEDSGTATGVFEVQMQHDVAATDPAVVINPVSNTSPKWGDEIQISGSIANADDGDNIELDWGDGTSDEVSLEGCSWGPVTHTYDGSALESNPNQLVVNLLSSDDTLKASSLQKEIEVQKRSAELTLDPVAHMIANTTVTLTGQLLDSDTSEPIADANVIFSGTGVIELATVSTDEDGEFTAIGSAVESPQNGLTAQAHFEGNALYNEIDSDVRTFDTVDPEAVQYPVQAGSNSRVELTEFGASMDFGDVVEDGIMYVSECTTSPVSVRFLTMDACLRISPAFQMVEGSSAIVNMSFAGLDIPNGYGTGDIDMFHEVISPDGSTTVIDITAKRGNETIIGNTTSFSNFILAVALHDEKPPGAHRSQIFVGVDNVVNLRDVNDQQNSSATVTVSFGKSSYGLSEDPVLTISDANGNVDPANNDIIYADVMSETSDPFFITVTLTETGPSTGNFQGSFGLTSGAS